MNTFALDTNIISYLLRNDPVVIGQLRKENDQGSMIVIPPLVYYEVKRGLVYEESPKRLRSFEYFCEDVSIGEMSIEAYDEAARLYANLRRAGRPVGDADLLIAAFCIASNYTLVTNNTKHFLTIDGLRIVDWSAAENGRA
jgi:predicted nucleic acid-binding protein